MPGGQEWTVDVKDWASPALLGRQIRPLPKAPRHDKAFMVVPGHRLSRRPGYLDIVIRNMRRAGVPLRVEVTCPAMRRKKTGVDLADLQTSAEGTDRGSASSAGDPTEVAHGPTGSEGVVSAPPEASPGS
jgi:hypothetical protein